jgi:hypothetical protein
MNHVEDDADPAYVAVRRLWERREPVLTRMDLAVETSRLAETHALVTRRAVTTVDGAVDGALGDGLDPGATVADESPRGLATAHDDLAPSAGDVTVSSGQHPALRMVEGFVRGGAIVGRASAPEAVLVIDTGTGAAADSGEAAVGVPDAIEIEIALDAESASWWEKRAADAYPDATRLPRRIEVGLVGGPVVEVMVSPEALLHGRALATARAVVPVPAGSSGLAAVVLRSAPPRRDGALPQSVIGVRINSVTVTRALAAH